MGEAGHGKRVEIREEVRESSSTEPMGKDSEPIGEGRGVTAGWWVLSLTSNLISTVLPRAVSLIALMMEAVRTSETLVNSQQSTRRYNPEDSHS
jgi:hypothetical protein